ncbi:CHASE2 domain-containing protein [Novosphingobium sp. B 225]|uniref:CHASE2 domain-containing protein n=1 Tax=Novosphingobium sp. B 225 TaxID=1961849 RepID=UPI000B4A8C40|nr:adenylate/guanylate cyclase domain-containing protein [Novosphingobium sp. B 225]
MKPRVWLRQHGIVVLAGLLAMLAVLAAQVLGLSFGERAWLLLTDSYARAAPRVWQDAAVKVVDIDDESIRRLGQWPWPRTDMARLTDRLTGAGASAIAFDVVFSEPDRTSPAALGEQLRRQGAGAGAIAALTALPDNDAELAKAFARAPVVAGVFLLNDRAGPALESKAGFAIAGSAPVSGAPRFARALTSLPALHAAAPGSGFVSLAAAEDGIVREVPLIAYQSDALQPALSLEALRLAQGAGAITLKTSDAGGEGGGGSGRMVAVKVGQFEVPTTASGALTLRYTAARPPRTIPAWQILSGELAGAELERAVGGSIVLIGTSAIGLRDLVSTPIRQREAGVNVHAEALEQMITGQFLVRPDWASGLERSLVIVLGILLALVLPRLGAVRGAALGLGLVAAMLGASWWAYVSRGFLLNPVWPTLALVLVYLIQTALVFYREERRRAYIHSAFDRYLSPELVRQIAASSERLELGGEDREMTVLFADIRGFSRISEGLGPRELIRFLIGFLTPMCDVLLGRRATIDKFIGDAILAFWNAPLDDPDQHVNAARAALDMAARLDALNRDPAARGADLPWPGEVRIGIGLNAGPCCVGNMGSAQRLSYSLIGDTVNLASRIEGLTKYYGVTIALGSALAAQLPQFALVELDRVRVVGRDAPEAIFALIGDEAVAAGVEFIALRDGFAALLTAYRARDWAGAERAIAELSPGAAAFGLGQTLELFRSRTAALALDPPAEGWDGVFAATEK